MVLVEGCAASCLFPIFNGDSMGNHEVIAKSAIANLAGQSHGEKEVRRCSNTSGRGKRCPRPAWGDWQRCEPCHKSNRRSIRRRWMKRLVDNCYFHDKDRFKWNPADYVDEEHIKWLFEKQGPVCYWCGKKNLSITNRKGNDGLQLERLSNSLPHLKRNCVFACGKCNRGSWQPRWRKEPAHLANVPTDPRLTHRAKVVQDRLCLELNSKLRIS